MSPTRAKPSKSKKLSLQRVLRSKDKTDKQLNMDTDIGYNTKLFKIVVFKSVKTKML